MSAGLLQQHGRLHRPQPHAAQRLGHRDAGPALLHHGRPQIGVETAAVAGPSHSGHVAAVIKQRRGGIAQSHLVRRKIEVHRPA